jgi:hypothetical protein
MRTKIFLSTIAAMIGSLILVSPSHAQERLKKIRITYPTESIAVLPLFAAYRWKIFEDNDLQAEIIQARSQVANAALASGEIGYFAGVGPASVSATLRGLQSRAVWFASDEIIYLLLARPEFSGSSAKEDRYHGPGGHSTCSFTDCSRGGARESEKLSVRVDHRGAAHGSAGNRRHRRGAHESALRFLR